MRRNQRKSLLSFREAQFTRTLAPHMTTVTITNADALRCSPRTPHAPPGLRALFTAAGLVAVKLSRIRAAVDAEAKHVAAAFDAVGKQFATVGEDGQPKMIAGEDGTPQAFSGSGTPAYEIDPAQAEAYRAAMAELDGGTVELRVARITEAELAVIQVGDNSAADALALFVEPPAETAAPA